MNDKNKIRLFAVGVFFLVLILTNPTKSDLENHLYESKQLKVRRQHNFILFSIYSTKQIYYPPNYPPEYHEVKYLGLLKNFWETKRNKTSSLPTSE